MTEDWFPGDPFADPDDPAAAERERRRQEREERRKTRREDKREEEQTVPEPPPEPSPPQAPRTPEEEFWDEPAAEEPPPVAASPPPPRPPGSGPFAAIRRHPLRSLAVVIVIAIAAAFAVRVLYRHFHRSAAPAPAVERTVTVTIPEGYSRAQTAPLAKEDGLRGSYEAASVHSKYLDPAHYGGKGAKSLEGFLFPDTFELKRHAPVSDLVQLQLEDFKRRIKGVDMGYARSKNLTTYDVVTIASMIEREAQVASERKLVAAVIYNRLHDGMPLGIDATIRFATGNYTRPLTESQLATPSPYNTRTNQGLPPGPIDSPGLASLEAAARPAKVSYLFYVVKPGTCGQLAFSTTEAQFQRNVERYNSAREAAGGNSPTTCGQ